MAIERAEPAAAGRAAALAAVGLGCGARNRCGGRAADRAAPWRQETVEGPLPGGWLTVANLTYAVCGVELAWIDLDVHRVPNRILTMLASVVGVVLAAAGSDRHDGLRLLAGAGAGP